LQFKAESLTKGGWHGFWKGGSRLHAIIDGLSRPETIAKKTDVNLKFNGWLRLLLRLA
jgi:hypothetical protein